MPASCLCIACLFACLQHLPYLPSSFFALVSTVWVWLGLAVQLVASGQTRGGLTCLPSHMDTCKKTHLCLPYRHGVYASLVLHFSFFPTSLPAVLHPHPLSMPVGEHSQPPLLLQALGTQCAWAIFLPNMPNEKESACLCLAEKKLLTHCCAARSCHTCFCLCSVPSLLMPTCLTVNCNDGGVGGGTAGQ